MLRRSRRCASSLQTRQLCLLSLLHYPGYMIPTLPAVKPPRRHVHLSYHGINPPLRSQITLWTNLGGRDPRPESPAGLDPSVYLRRPNFREKVYRVTSHPRPPMLLRSHSCSGYHTCQTSQTMWPSSSWILH